jgi:multiple sugar transport system permease protein
MPSRPEQRHTKAAIGFLAPFVVIYTVFIVGPAIYMLVMSFFSGSLVKPGLGKFVGFGNFSEALGSNDFWQSLWHTLLFTILTTPPLIILAFVFALLAERAVRMRGFFRLAFFTPFILPSVVAALIWVWIYTPAVGLLPDFLTRIGISTPPNFLGDPSWAMWSVAFMAVWWTLGFNFVLYLAGLQEIPKQLYEAAAIDGAGPWQQIRHITVPMLGRTTTLVAVLQVIASLKVFDQIYIMTSGGPNFSTRPSVMYIYDVGFTSYRTGYAASVSTLLFIVTLIVSVIWFTIVSRQQKDV